MRSARWYGPQDVRVQEAPDPVAAQNEAVVDVAWVGLCGSDAEEFMQGPVVATAPRILGHEISGTVRHPAADGTGPPRGTRVVVDVVTGCGECAWCRRHEEGQCPRLVVTGQHRDGGLAERVVARADRLIAVPPHVSLRQAAMAEPLAVAVRALRKAGGVDGADVLVVGGGTIGLLCAQVARSLGAVVTVLEPSDGRRRVAGGLGLHAIWSDEPSVRAELVDQCSGELGMRCVIECSGRRTVVAESIRLAGPRSRTVLLGVLAEPEPLDILDIVLSEKTVVGSAGHMWDVDVQAAVSLLSSGVIDVDALITAEFPLARTGEAFERLATPRRHDVKVVVRVGDPAAPG